MAFRFGIFNGVETDLEQNLREIRHRIAGAAAKSGRSVKLVSVSKTHPTSVLHMAIDAGANILGENKVQEAESKIAELGRDSAEWHLIGHLQSNKARKAVQLFDVIQTIDSIELAERLERICGEEGRDSLSVFVQVDLAGEETKSGVAENELPPLVDFLKGCRHLRFDGLMIVPPFSDDIEKSRPYFERLRAIRDKLTAENAFNSGPGELSMGMSHDFEVAVEEGATVVRIGTAIFGAREYLAANL
ncbi:MAG: YggS family pyridoxal phosphate-dependent enzyme [Acidobacteriota bacterium]